MKLVVIDASAIVEYLLRTERTPSIDDVVHDPEVDLHTPALCDVEVTAALRRGLLGKRLDQRRAEQALQDYLDLPLVRHGHAALLRRALELRANFSAYDAVYVALAERLEASLLSADDGLCRAVSRHTAVVTA